MAGQRYLCLPVPVGSLEAETRGYLDCPEQDKEMPMLFPRPTVESRRLGNAFVVVRRLPSPEQFGMDAKL